MDKKQILGIISVVIIAIWMSIGFFPLVNFEGDSSYYITGCNVLCNEGYKLPPVTMYEWDMQPLASLLICGLHKCVPALSCEACYCLLTILCTLTFIFYCTKLTTSVTNAKWYECIWVLFTLPEVVAISYYGNTAIFAITCLTAALYYAFKHPLNVKTILLLGMAPLFRVDILCIYPVLLFVLLKTNKFKESFIDCVIYLFCTLAIWIVGCVLFKANPLNTFQKKIAIDSVGSSLLRKLFWIIEINGAFYTFAAVVLIVLGLTYLFKKKEWVTIFLAMTPILINNYIYFPYSGCGTKHLLYSVPFLCIIMVQSKEILINLYHFKRKKLYFMASIAILFSFIGISAVPASKPWLGKDYTSSSSYPKVDIISADIKGNTVCLGLGAGLVLPTCDERMLATGNFFLPFYYHHFKQFVQQSTIDLESVVDAYSPNDTIRIMASNYGLSDIYKYASSNGYKYVSDRTIFTKIGKPSIEYHEVVLEKNADSFNENFNALEPPFFFYATTYDPELYYINERLTKARPINRSVSIIE